MLKTTKNFRYAYKNIAAAKNWQCKSVRHKKKKNIKRRSVYVTIIACVNLSAIDGFADFIFQRPMEFKKKIHRYRCRVLCVYKKKIIILINGFN